MNYPKLDESKIQDTLNHMINGAIASAIASGTINLRRVRNEEINSGEALRETIKRSSQGAIAAGAAMKTADYLSQKGGFLKAMATVSVGIAGIYAMEVLDKKLDAKKLTLKNDEEIIKIEEK